MRQLAALLVALAIAVTVSAQDGPLTNLANLLVRTDANGYLLAVAQDYDGPDGPLRTLANTLGRTDANGYLIITNPSGFGGGAPDDAEFWVGAANADLTAEKNLGALATALVINTSGTPSAYAGASCTNQFIRALSAIGAATCATVSLSDTSGIAPSTAGYWTDAADGTLSAERNLGALATALLINTAGVPSAYAGASCTNQFIRALSAVGAATCASVSLTADVTGTLGVGSGGTGTATAFTAGSVIFAGGSGIYAQDNANLFWDDTNNRLGIGTSAAPARSLDVFASTDTAVRFTREDNVTNDVRQAFEISHMTTGTPAAGIGVSFALNAEKSNGNPGLTGIVAGLFSSVSSGAEVGAISLQPSFSGEVATEVLRVRGDGVVSVPFGQILFPASQNSSSNVNTLDDYEEGDWTPVIGGTGGESGQAYSSQLGKYVKIGQFVMASCVVSLSTEGTITGNVRIEGLPFTVLNSVGARGGFIGRWTNLGSNWNVIIMFPVENTTTLGIVGNTTESGDVNTDLTATDIGNTSSFQITVVYRATS